LAITPTHLTVGQLFQQNFIFRVPKYQRYYAWNEEQIEDFLKDLEVCVGKRRAGGVHHHFLGGIVTVSTPMPGSVRRNVEVIDGQQRLATFSILAHELVRAMRALAGTSDRTSADCPADFLLTTADALWRQYQSFPDTVALRVEEIPRLELSKPDKLFYQQMLAEQSPQPTRRSHEMLLQAKECIAARLAKMIETGTDVQRAQELSYVSEVLASDWTVIHMSADQKSEAYMLFQVLNDRGAGLTEGELLRARTLEMLDSGGTTAQSQIVEEAWDAVLAGKPEQIGEGLRWIYSSYEAKRPGKTTLFDEFMDARFPMHIAAQLTQQQAESVVSTTLALKNDFERISSILDGQWPYSVLVPRVTAWDRDRLRLLILELKLHVCMPLLIAASSLDQIVFAQVVHLLERFMYRYKIVVNARIESAMKVFLDHAKIIREQPAGFTVAELSKQLKELLDRHAPDPLFKNRLDEQKYATSSTTKPLKYLLLTLDAYEPWYSSGGMGMPTASKTTVADFAANTLEHVYAQNAASFDPAMTDCLHILGNLAVLSPADNGAVGNLPFTNKKAVFANSPSPLNRQIAAANAWGATEVGARQNRLKDMAIKVFAL